MGHEGGLSARIPADGIQLTRLIPMFYGRVRNDEEVLDWLTECAKWDPSTNLVLPRETP